ncbi:helix-turn-helix domain-containing protein [Nocardia sp. CA-084685]|uniref:helix-turn-helix domain-containing protein n=1 Tax=Nocardia sp. CA-084685 TaxID=3239970 RepID=UPI003D97B10B
MPPPVLRCPTRSARYATEPTARSPRGRPGSASDGSAEKSDPSRRRTATRGGGARPGKITDADRQRIVELHAQGKGRNEIADILGVTRSAIT